MFVVSDPRLAESPRQEIFGQRVVDLTNSKEIFAYFSTSGFCIEYGIEKFIVFGLAITDI